MILQVVMTNAGGQMTGCQEVICVVLFQGHCNSLCVVEETKTSLERQTEQESPKVIHRRPIVSVLR